VLIIFCFIIDICFEKMRSHRRVGRVSVKRGKLCCRLKADVLIVSVVFVTPVLRSICYLLRCLRIFSAFLTIFWVWKLFI
jgi:hypothetical protein